MSSPIAKPTATLTLADLTDVPAELLISALTAKLDDELTTWVDADHSDEKAPKIPGLIQAMVLESDLLKDNLTDALSDDLSEVIDPPWKKDAELATASDLLKGLARTIRERDRCAVGAAEFDYQFDLLAHDFRKSGAVYKKAWDAF